MSFKFTTPRVVQAYMNPFGYDNSFWLLAPTAAQLAAAQAQFANSELRAMMSNDGSIAFLHLAGFPDPWDNTKDVQGNIVIQAGIALAQIAELQPWLLAPFAKVGITTGGLYYCNAGAKFGLAGIANATSLAVSLATYLGTYGAQMPPPVSSI